MAMFPNVWETFDSDCCVAKQRTTAPMMRRPIAAVHVKPLACRGAKLMLFRAGYGALIQMNLLGTSNWILRKTLARQT